MNWQSHSKNGGIEHLLLAGSVLVKRSCFMTLTYPTQWLLASSTPHKVQKTLLTCKLDYNMLHNKCPL